MSPRHRRDRDNDRREKDYRDRDRDYRGNGRRSGDRHDRYDRDGARRRHVSGCLIYVSFHDAALCISSAGDALIFFPLHNCVDRLADDRIYV
ncbi:hypothetical protein GH714_017363 [Hevea brasiliensis]|uniref:Uncharacterized protein n=1 Tax=Hevea brasiliensis TaxID=3981 RepID=A0A6A6NI11_HEVBR|nr:hypothetical protein GH714_017363 [Hevea brasiliensis]